MGLQHVEDADDEAVHGGHDAHGGHSHSGHSGHADHVARFRRLFWINLALAVPVVALSGSFADLLGYSLPGGLGWIAAALGTVMFVWGGRPFLTGGLDEIRKRQPGMMLLIALGITVAFVSSWGATLSIIDSGLEFWWELALLVVIMLLGHWIEMRSLAGTTSALESLASLIPDEAERIGPDGETAAVDPADLAVGDIVLVRPGGGVPVDGEVIDGAADMDESMITGESVPVRRGLGDTVVAGTVATDSGLRIRVTATGEDTALSGIRRLVEQAQDSSSRAQRIADRAAAWLFWFALSAALLTALGWALIGSADDAVTRTITVLVIACPHALGLAIPLVVAIATERAARAGVLVKDRLALEGMRSVDAVVFDKTGTLTEGEPEVTGLLAASGGDRGTVLALAAAAESASEHPLARAIVRRAEHDAVDVPEAAEFSSSPAVGVTARVDGAEVRVGGPHLLAEAGRGPLSATAEWSRRGDTVLHVLRGGEVVGAVAVADAVRPQSRDTVAALHHRGTTVVMLTGDAETVARSVADDLGIDEVFAGVRPEDKARKVRDLQDRGRTVAMVGDGVNDAPALAQADVGIAIGAGTDVAIGSAGVILAGDDPRAVLSVIALSQRGYRKMRQNLWWAAGYNLISVPLAAGVLAPIGFTMPMSVGAVLMSLSTVVVALNAQLLRRLDLDPATVAGTADDGGERRGDTARVSARVG